MLLLGFSHRGIHIQKGALMHIHATHSRADEETRAIFYSLERRPCVCSGEVFARNSNTLDEEYIIIFIFFAPTSGSCTTPWWTLAARAASPPPTVPPRTNASSRGNKKDNKTAVSKCIELYVRRLFWFAVFASGICVTGKTVIGVIHDYYTYSITTSIQLNRHYYVGNTQETQFI